MKLHVIAVPFNGGSRKKGTELAPQLLIGEGLMNSLKNHTVTSRTIDCSNLPGSFGSFESVGEVSQRLRKAVSASLERGELPVVIGGDHAVAWGSIAGTLDVFPDTHLVYIDAHGDFNTPQSSPSGNIHGMHLAFIGGVSNTADYVESFNHRTMPLSAMHFYATRALDNGETATAALNNMDITTAAELNMCPENTAADILTEKIKSLPTQHIHLSFDIDAIDPEYAPGTGVPETGGITPHMAMKLLDAVILSGKTATIDLVEYNPLLDKDNRTLNLMLQACRNIAGNLKA